MDSDKYYILFTSYNWGLLLESKLKKEKIKYTIVPTPRQLSVSCGMSIMYNKIDEEKIKSIIKDNNIEIKGLFCISSK